MLPQPEHMKLKENKAKTILSAFVTYTFLTQSAFVLPKDPTLRPWFVPAQVIPSTVT
jgi:hypothetical protein